MPSRSRHSARPVYLRPVRTRVHLDEKIIGWQALDEQGTLLATAPTTLQLKGQFPPETRFIDVEGLLSH